VKKPFGDLPHYQWEMSRSKSQSVTLVHGGSNWFTYSMPLLVPDVAWLSGLKANIQITSSSGVPHSVTMFVVAAPEGGKVLKEGLVKGCPGYFDAALDGHCPVVDGQEVVVLSRKGMVVQGSVGGEHVAIAYRKWYAKLNRWNGLTKKGKVGKRMEYYVVIVVQGFAVQRREAMMGLVVKGVLWCRGEKPCVDDEEGDAVMK
jgi:hypothetical protein